jgi:hypothetical protein
MTMLEGCEFLAGSLRDAHGLCLILPRTDYEKLILVAPGEPRKAVFLSGQYSYRGFNIEDTNWDGIVVPNIRIEVDLSTPINTNRYDVSAGAIVRKAGYLAIVAEIEGDYGFVDRRPIPLVNGLPSCGDNLSVGFCKWQIVLGEGQAKRVLKTFDVSLPKP